MVKKAFLVLILILFAGLISCATTKTVTFKGSDSVTLKGTLMKPEGKGPFPAVVLLHACDGIKGEKGAAADFYNNWASRLRSWGYLTLLVDSFGPRGDSSICNSSDLQGKYVLKRAMDAHDAQSYLAGKSFVDPKRIAVMGWSHGALSLIAAVSEMPGKTVVPFQAAIAFYPYCYKTLADLNAPLLILIGASDDWCPAKLCSSNMPKEGKAKHEVILKVYPGAYHGFDRPRDSAVIYLGHVIQYDRQATSDSILQVKEFLEKYLK
jgi:dienelactone hydrolase